MESTQTTETPEQVDPMVRLHLFAFEQSDGYWLVAAADIIEAKQLLADESGYATVSEMRADGWNMRGRKMGSGELVLLHGQNSGPCSVPARALIERPGVVVRPEA